MSRVSFQGLPPWPKDTLPDIEVCNEYVKNFDHVCEVFKDRCHPASLTAIHRYRMDDEGAGEVHRKRAYV